MNRKVFTLLLVCLFSLFCMQATAQVEYVFSSTVTDEGVVVEAYDAWFASKDARHGQTAILLSSVFNGESAATHTVILDFPDYASLEKAMNATAVSGDFAKMELRNSNVATGLGEGLYLRVLGNGKSYNAGDFLFAIGVQVNSGEAKAYAKAFKEFIDSDIGKKAPGMLRLMANRAGSSVSHVVLVSAPTFTALNKYMDASDGSDAFADFISKVKDISVGVDPSIYSVVKIWK